MSRERAYLDLARDPEAPCTLKLVPCFGQVVFCHSDQLADGRGIGHKSHFGLSVLGCVACHSKFTRAYLGREGYAEVHYKALKGTLLWLHQTGKLRVA